MLGVICCSSVRRACGLFSTPVEAGVDFQLGDAEEALQAARHGRGDGLAQQGGGAHLLPRLRETDLLREQAGLRTRRAAGGEQRPRFR